jgi:hypothetical protein
VRDSNYPLKDINERMGCKIRGSCCVSFGDLTVTVQNENRGHEENPVMFNARHGESKCHHQEAKEQSADGPPNSPR